MYPARSTLERESLRDLEQRLRANGWVEHGADMLESFGGLELCLLRFLRARSLDVDRAAEALSATLEFRRKNEVGSVETVAAVRRDGISNWWCGVFAGVTSTGCPVTYWRFRCIDTDRLKQVDETQLKRYYIAWMEHGLALQREVRLHQLWWILGTLRGEYPAESTQNPGGAPRVSVRLIACLRGTPRPELTRRSAPHTGCGTPTDRLPGNGRYLRHGGCTLGPNVIGDALALWGTLCRPGPLPGELEPGSLGKCARVFRGNLEAYLGTR